MPCAGNADLFTRRQSSADSQNLSMGQRSVGHNRTGVGGAMKQARRLVRKLNNLKWEQADQHAGRRLLGSQTGVFCLQATGT